MISLTLQIHLNLQGAIWKQGKTRPVLWNPVQLEKVKEIR